MSLPIIGLALAIASGLSSFIAGKFYSGALGAGGDGSVVAAISGSYPAISYSFCVLTGLESFTGMKALGVLFAILSCVCFSL